MNQINSQFTGHGVLVKQGAISIVDASVTPTLRKPKGKSSYTLAEGQESPLDKTRQPGVDQEDRWVKKGGKLQYGYKRHYLAEAQKGLVLAVHTTPANVHDSQLETLARCGLNVGDFGYIMVNQIFIHQLMIKKRIPDSFVSVDVSRRTRRSKFLQQIDALIDWTVFEKELYKVCKRSLQDAAGRPACNPLVLFKMMLLQTWYNLSDMGVEDMVNDTLSADAFCELRVEDTGPNHSNPKPL